MGNHWRKAKADQYQSRHLALLLVQGQNHALAHQSGIGVVGPTHDLQYVLGVIIIHLLGTETTMVTGAVATGAIIGEVAVNILGTCTDGKGTEIITIAVPGEVEVEEEGDLEQSQDLRGGAGAEGGGGLEPRLVHPGIEDLTHDLQGIAEIGAFLLSTREMKGNCFKPPKGLYPEKQHEAFRQLVEV